MHIWIWFLELAASRGGSGFGSNPIGYADIGAWSDLTGRRPNTLEVGLLRELDMLALRLNAEHAEKKKR